MIGEIGYEKTNAFIYNCHFYYLLLLFSLSAKAYTYGDPNKEALAEVYKEMLIELDKTPPDFSTAEKHYKTVKEEVDMHMGPDPSKSFFKILKIKIKNKQSKYG